MNSIRWVNRIVCFPSKEQHLLLLALLGIMSVWNQTNSTLRLFEVLILHISFFFFYMKGPCLWFFRLPYSWCYFPKQQLTAVVFSLPCRCHAGVCLKAELQCNESLYVCVSGHTGNLQVKFTVPGCCSQFSLKHVISLWLWEAIWPANLARSRLNPIHRKLVNLDLLLRVSKCCL